MVYNCNIHEYVQHKANFMFVGVCVRSQLINNNLLYELQFVEYFNVIVCVRETKKAALLHLMLSSLCVYLDAIEHRSLYLISTRAYLGFRFAFTRCRLLAAIY